MKKKILILSSLAASVIATLSLYLNVTNPCNDVMSTGVPEPQCEALVDFYESTNGDNWSNNTNWMNFDVPISQWHGVVVVDAGVYKISLINNQLSGQIPESFGDLTSLTTVYLNYNQLSGQIPESIGNLNNLERLWLLNNQLSGQIPESIGNLNNLERLSLYNNQLSGQIPDSVGNLTSLESLALYGNQLSGQIPESIGNLTSLEHLWLYGNQLSGQIPESFGDLTSLKWLFLYNNQLTGQIPDSIGGLTSLERLRLHNNYLSGDLPVSIISNAASNSNNPTVYTLYGNCLNDLTSEHESALLNNPVLSNNNFLFYEQGDAEYCTPEVEDGLVADLNGDGVVSVTDLLTFLTTYGTSGPEGDFNGDGVVSAPDLLFFLTQYGGEAPSSSGMPAFDPGSGERIIPDSIQDALASAGHPIKSKEEILKMEEKMEREMEELMKKQEQELMQKLTEEEAPKEETQVKEEVYKTRR